MTAREGVASVILVDDHPLVRAAVRQAISGADIDVIGEAGDCAAALALTESLRPDLVLLDLDLPGRSGLDFLREIRNRDRATRVVVLTVSAADRDLVEAVRLGAAGYVTKDVTGDALKAPGLALAISGSGTVKLMQLAADEISPNVSGSGDIAFGGRTGRLLVAISGRGNVDARALEADDVTLSVAGSGDADVTARKTLTVSIAGVGNVKYTGDATVKSSIAGHGNIGKH